MSVNFVNPYSGETEETCSTSFAAQQQMAGTVSSPQTEADYNKSKLLGEWGVIKAKLAKGEIPKGTKILAFTAGGSRGYITSNGKAKPVFVKYNSAGKKSTYPVDKEIGDDLIKSAAYDVAIPQSTKPNSAPPKPLTGQSVHGAVPSGLYKPDTLTLQQEDALKNYETGAYKSINGYLRKEGATNDPFEKSAAKYIPIIDSAMDNSKLTSPIEVYRGMYNSQDLFGADNLSGDLSGFVWQEKGYGSTTSNKAVADGYKLEDEFNHPKYKGGNVQMLVRVPAGVKALQTSTWTQGSTANGAQAEITLERGLKWKVVKDNGYVNGIRQLEVEVYPANESPESDGQAIGDAKPSAGAADGKEEGKQVAAPTPAQPVNAGSDSPGSMSHEDVSALFVKIKDDLAKEQGLNIKGANPQLDQLVFAKIGEVTGYTPDEIKGKIDAYKAAGNKLSALKKKVMAGTYKVPAGKPTPAKQTSPSGPLSTPQATHPDGMVVAVSPDGQKQLIAQGGGYQLQQKHAILNKWYDVKKYPTIEAAKKADKSLLSKSTNDPKPNGVPTVATPKIAEQIKKEVKEEVKKDPAKVYSDEDVAAAYIIAKDKIVAESNGKWTLYTKSDELDMAIAIEVGLKTGGLNPTQQKVAIANYLASGKKLSVLKKQLIKQGAMKPQADTLKKSGAAKTQEEKAKEVEEKADAGYTPTPTPATGTPKKDTGKPAPKAVVEEAQASGDIGSIPDSVKSSIYTAFKNQGSKAYLSSSNEQTYEALVATQAQLKAAEGLDLTLLQILRVIDEQGAKKFKAENGKLFEKKTATWLTSPQGTQYVKDQQEVLAKKAEAAAKKAKDEAEALAAAKKLQANQPPLPADSSQFQEMSPTKAQKFQDIQLEAKPFGPGEKEGLRVYTGSAYHEMNGWLRGLNSSISDANKRHIEKAKKGFRPAPEPMLLRRGTSRKQFSLDSDAAIWGLTGKTLQDKGFLSTSAAGRAAFGGEVAMEIELPQGAPCMWVDNFSKHRGENEMLLPPGTKYKVLNVRKEGTRYVVRVRVVEWDVPA